MRLSASESENESEHAKRELIIMKGHSAAFVSLRVLPRGKGRGEKTAVRRKEIDGEGVHSVFTSIKSNRIGQNGK